MVNPAEVISVLMVLEFVVMALVVLLLVPLDVAAPLIPLLLAFLIALQISHSVHALYDQDFSPLNGELISVKYSTPL